MIYVHPANAVEYYEKNKLRLVEYEHKLAESPDGTSIYLVDEDDTPVINVYFGDTLIADHEADEDSLQTIYQLCIDQWGIIEDDMPDDEEDPDFGFDGSVFDDDEDLLIDEREDALTNLASEFIFDILGDDADEVGAVEVEEAANLVKEVVCKILADRFDFPVYRPMYLISESGKRFFTKYPYPQMVDPKDSKNSEH